MVTRGDAEKHKIVSYEAAATHDDVSAPNFWCYQGLSSSSCMDVTEFHRKKKKKKLSAPSQVLKHCPK